MASLSSPWTRGMRAFEAAALKALARLAFEAVAEGLTGRLDPAGEGRLAHEAVAPHVVEQLFFGDHPIAVDEEIREDVEHLWFDGDRHPASASTSLSSR